MFGEVANYSFEWDPIKDMENRRKHGVSFDEASSVFFNEEAEVEFDREQFGEDRFAIIGLSSKWRRLRVIFTLRGWNEKSIRIITARKYGGR